MFEESIHTKFWACMRNGSTEIILCLSCTNADNSRNVVQQFSVQNAGTQKSYDTQSRVSTPYKPHKSMVKFLSALCV